MAELKAKTRNKLPAKDFAEPAGASIQARPRSVTQRLQSELGTRPVSLLSRVMRF